MKTIYAGKCDCGHTTTHTWPNRLTGEWRLGYDGECRGMTKGGDTCHRPIFMTCTNDQDQDEAA